MKIDKVINVMTYFMGMAFNLAILAVVAFAVWQFTLWGFSQGEYLANAMVYVGEDYEIEFILEEDTSAADVARMLEDLDVINNAMLFQAEIFLMGRANYYSAGTYTLNRNMSNTDVHRILRGRSDTQAPHQVIRVLEGWTLRDMAEYFEYREFFPAEEFLYVAQNGHFSFAFLQDVPIGRPNRLEGYLFPETYHISLNPTPGEIITIMLRQFEIIFDEAMHYRAEEMGLSVDAVITIASIVEAETRVAQERPMVAQVIHSRLAQNMLLQMDSTVKYGMEDPPVRLLYAHLEIDSPWNTYMHLGLPLGPIANPSEAAIRAVLYPSDTNYLFFVLTDIETGVHYFTRTFSEHQAAIDRYRPW
ncbi:MAG: endolytic transglycosylase MltG [Defluviitaleaceae bacterium]|nr:endolytic transglycosylase MltG [Defluviitaleaceae bacterium]